MLKLTKKLEYSLIALRYMRKMEYGQLSTAREIADEFCIPKEILAKTLQQLSKLEIVHSVKGPSGGYRVKKSFSNLRLMDFIESIEGPQGLVDCEVESECTIIDCCNIRQPIKAINQNLKNMFNNILVTEITQ